MQKIWLEKNPKFCVSPGQRYQNQQILPQGGCCPLEIAGTLLKCSPFYRFEWARFLSNFHLFFLLLTNSPEVNDDTAEALKPNFIWAISCLYYVYLSWLQGGYVKHYIWYMPRWWSFEEKKGWFVKDDRAIPSGSLKKNR